MRPQRVRDGRSRSPPRMRTGDRGYSPPPILDRQYAQRIRSHQYSPPIQDHQYPRFPDRAPQFRGRDYSPRIQDRCYSPQFRDRDYSPRIRDHGYSPRISERQYSPHCQYSVHHHEIQERPLGMVSEFSRGSASVEAERSRRVSNGENIVGRREYDRPPDQDREGQFRKLSQFNDALPQESPSVKFQWSHLLTEPTNTNIGATKPVSGYGIGSSRMTTEKGYRGSGFSDLGWRGGLPEKPMSMSMEQDKATTFSAVYADVDPPKTSAHLDGNFSLPSENNIRLLRKDEGLQFQDRHMRAEKPTKRDVYTEEDKSYFYSRDASQYTRPTSHSKTFPMASSGIATSSFHGSYNDDLTLPSSGYTRRRGMPTDLVGCDDGYGQTPFYKSAANSEAKPKDGIDYRQVDLSFMERKDKDHVYPELRRSDRSDRRMLSDEYYENLRSVGEDYANHDPLRADIGDPSVDRTVVTEGSPREHLRESRPWDQQHSYGEHLTPALLGSSRTSRANKRDKEVLAPRSSYLEFEPEVYQDYESFPTEKDYTFQRDAGPWAYEQKLKRSPMLECDPGLYTIDGSSQQRGATRKLHMHKEKMLKSRGLVDKKLSKRKLGSKLLSNRKFGNKIPALSNRDEQWARRDVGTVLSKKSAFSRLNYKRTGRAFSGMASSRTSEPDDWLSSQTLSVLKRNSITGVQKSASTNTEKSMRSLPWTVQAQQSNVRKPKPFKSHKKNKGRSSDCPHVHKDSSPEVKESLAKTEPPEGSEDFRQLVHNAFLKFVKQLNENPAQRRKYTKQGSTGILKCSICGRNSEEFMDTQSLAMHAFVSTTTGIKTQHLGFHKALCLLMGWNSLVPPKSSWVCKVLPDAEALALKEDLIIWPPLIIVHNSSIENDDQALRTILSNEELKAHLIDKGFGGGNVKVCRGKPANQSVMVVTFSGTFSGLQEAERLHKFYAEKQHGRAEFQNLSCSSRNEETEKVVDDNVEQALYGYLGLAGDLDKLDFEMKKRCVVKSKRDIQAIADAPVKLE